MMSTYESNIPGAPEYANASLIATNAYSNALARLNQKRMGTLQQYGYKANVDPNTGMLSNLAVDPGNPYGQFQQMLGTHASQAQAAEDNAIGRGLHGGLANQIEADVHNGFGADAAQLGSSLTNDLAGYQDEQNQAAYTRDNALWQAQHDAELAAVAGGDFNQGDYTGLNYPDYGSTTMPAGSDDPTDPANELAAVGGDLSNIKNNAVTNTHDPADRNPPATHSGAHGGVKVPQSVRAKVVAKASAAALEKAKTSGASVPASALAARSAGMNALYGIKKKGGK